MAHGMSLLKKNGVFWRDLRQRKRIDHVVQVESMFAVPKKLRGELYIVGGSKNRNGPFWCAHASAVIASMLT